MRTEKLRGFLFPLPPLSEQVKIVEKIKILFSFADEIEKFVDEAKKLADRMDHIVLANAFSGRLVPQDPNDVSASVLLERINNIEGKSISNDTTDT